MSDTKFTPGPWTVQELHHCDGELWLQIGFFYEGKEIGPVAELKYLVARPEEQRANADLIAASPALYAALAALVADNETRARQGHDVNWAAIHQAHEALNQAVPQARGEA